MMDKKVKNKSFIFNVEWQEILLAYPAEVRLEVYDAIVEYVVSGTFSELKPMAKMAFSFIKKEIDYNTNKYDEIVAKRSEAGKKAMEKRYNKKSGSLTNGNKTNKCYQTVANLTDNDNDNDNVYVSDKSDINKTSTNVDSKENHDSEKTPYDKFCDWVKANAPNVLKLQRQITEPQFLKLKEKYDYKQIISILQSMDNHKELTKKYTSVYLTFLNWAKKAYGD